MHKFILSARSSVFEKMFSHKEMAENRNKKVNITDISPEVMEHFIAYIYSGNIDAVTKYSTELLEAADKVFSTFILILVKPKVIIPFLQYDIQPLVKVCIESMLRNISSENVARIFFVADIYQLKELKLKAMDYITHSNEQSVKVMASKDWAKYILPKPLLMQKLFAYKMSK